MPSSLRLITATFAAALLAALALPLAAQPASVPTAPYAENVTFNNVRLRDSCVLADAATKTYYLVSATNRVGPNGRPAVIGYTSRDLKTWNGPTVVFEIPADFWAQKDIWAPELHAYRGKYYLFLTFDSGVLLPEQWRNWIPRVKRASQILVADAPFGPYKPFANISTTPPDMMTLDGTLFVEDGKPYMVYCHEWVQIKDGTIEYVPLADDLSAMIGEPKHLLHGSDAPWSRKSGTYGCHVTDGPFFYRSKTDKLLMIWSSMGKGGYNVGIASSRTGKLAGPWDQQAEPIYSNNGGHAMLFKRFDGQLMMILHQPNKAPTERERFYEMEDLGDTLRVIGPYPAENEKEKR